METHETVILRCDDHAEAVAFHRYNFEHPINQGCDFDVSFEDSYCGGDFTGIKGRFKRAWRAFFAKPIFYTSVYIQDKEKIKKWLEDCLSLVNDSDASSEIESLKTRIKELESYEKFYHGLTDRVYAVPASEIKDVIDAKGETDE